MEVNHNQRSIMVTKIKKALDDKLDGKVIAVLGLTFKPNTDDIRESPSLDILPPLVAAGARVKAFDPAGTSRPKS